MILFIRNVPRNLSRRELRDVVQEALKPRIRLPFYRVPMVTKAEFLMVHDKDTGATERHGLVTVQSGSKADAALKKLRHLRLNGQMCAVRPYVKRRVQDDLRFQGEGASESASDRQAHDRRRPNLKVEIERQPYVHGLNVGTKYERIRT